MLRDRDAFPLFFDTVRSIEPAVAAAVERVARDVDAQTSERLADTVRRIFRDVLRELEDVDNPMRTPLGSDPGDGATLDQPPAPEADADAAGPKADEDDDLPVLDPTEPRPDRSNRSLADASQDARPSGRSAPASPSLLPDQPGTRPPRRFDPDTGVVLHSEVHPDYLLVKDDEPALLEYLTHLVVKDASSTTTPAPRRSRSPRR